MTEGGGRSTNMDIFHEKSGIPTTRYMLSMKGNQIYKKLYGEGGGGGQKWIGQENIQIFMTRNPSLITRIFNMING